MSRSLVSELEEAWEDAELEIDLLTDDLEEAYARISNLQWKLSCEQAKSARLQAELDKRPPVI